MKSLLVAFISVRPTHVELLWDGSPMSVNNEYELKCQSFGSQPSSVITWWINGDQQRKAEKNEVTPSFIHTKMSAQTKNISLASLSQLFGNLLILILKIK